MLAKLEPYESEHLMIPLNIMNLERPHRSGVIGVLVAYAVLSFGCELAWAGVPGTGEASLMRTILCDAFPWACMQPRQAAPPPKQYQVTKLIYCPKCPVKERNNRCYWNMRAAFLDGRIVKQLSLEEPSCDTKRRDVTSFPAKFDGITLTLSYWHGERIPDINPSKDWPCCILMQ